MSVYSQFSAQFWLSITLPLVMLPMPCSILSCLGKCLNFFFFLLFKIFKNSGEICYDVVRFTITMQPNNFFWSYNVPSSIIFRVHFLPHCICLADCGWPLQDFNLFMSLGTIFKYHPKHLWMGGLITTFQSWLYTLPIVWRWNDRYVAIGCTDFLDVWQPVFACCFPMSQVHCVHTCDLYFL
jgi:hypothetical protein